MPKSAPSAVLTLRVPRDVDRQLSREARRRRISRSEVVREILVASLGDRSADELRAEARRQSLLANAQVDDDLQHLLTTVTDVRGWV